MRVYALLLLALIVPFTAFAGKPTRFDDYLKTRSYEHRLFETATTLAAREAVTCAQSQYKVQRLHQKILAPVSFDPRKPDPIAGIWFEEVNVLVCGEARKVDVTAIANPQAAPPELKAAFVQNDVRSTK